MTLKQRMSRSKTSRQCVNCQSSQVSHLGTSVLTVSGYLSSESEVEHRFRCRSCFFRWSEYV